MAQAGERFKGVGERKREGFGFGGGGASYIRCPESRLDGIWAGHSSDAVHFHPCSVEARTLLHVAPLPSSKPALFHFVCVIPALGHDPRALGRTTPSKHCVDPTVKLSLQRVTLLVNVLQESRKVTIDHCAMQPLVPPPQ